MRFIAYYILLAIVLISACAKTNTPEKIDRKALVMRHNVLVHGYDSLASLSVGNGNFAFTTDLTGLQTFYEDYENGIPLGTQSNWGWHSFPNTNDYSLEETNKYYQVNGREIPYRHQLKSSERAAEACNYFRANPQRLHLGIIGFELTKSNGEKAIISDIKNAKHELNLWTGAIHSSFVFEGEEVDVELYCHQKQDLIAAKITSPLIEKGQLAIQWKLPAAVAQHTGPAYDFSSPESHSSYLNHQGSNKALIIHKLDTTNYDITIEWQGEATIQQTKEHTYRLQASQGNSLSFSCLFTPEYKDTTLPDYEDVKANNMAEWNNFWQKGGAVDFSACTDPRAHELERRVLLSQYLTKIQCSGDMPPAETGLTYNSWYGKFHLEMHWWHVAHFASWQRTNVLEKQLGFYNKLLPVARQTASDQGYKGIRWPKMIGPDGENSPSSVGSYLIWQQAHVIWFAEQMYQHSPTENTLKQYKDLVFATAEFMADFPVWNEVKTCYDLAPPLIPAQEHWDLETSKNPPFELAYWYWGLSTAQKWRERLGMDKDDDWEIVRLNLATPDQANGVYLGIEGATDSYTNEELMRDHPIVLAAYGILPNWDKIDPEIMRNTLHTINENWKWASTWGWDYPMAAMTATRLGEAKLALDLLLKDVQKNTYLVNGHNYQDERLRLYLPGNGGLLSAIAMMCAGWEGCTTQNPGFPTDGTWKVNWENLSPVF